MPAKLSFTVKDGVPNIEIQDMPANNKQKMAEMMGAMLAIQAIQAIQITPTDELKTIEGYHCRKYNVNLAIINGEYWVSKDVKGYRELKALCTRVGTIAERNAEAD